MFQRVARHDLLHGDVRPRQEPDQPDQADRHVLGGHRRRQRALRVKGQQLEDWREDQRQEAAADRAHQRDDEVQLRDEDGEGACRRTSRGTVDGLKGDELNESRGISRHARNRPKDIVKTSTCVGN